MGTPEVLQAQQGQLCQSRVHQATAVVVRQSAKPAASSALFPVCHARLANTELARGPAFLAMQGAQQVDILAKVNALSAPMASMLTCPAGQIAKPSNVARKVNFELGTASSAVVTVQVVHLANIRP